MDRGRGSVLMEAYAEVDVAVGTEGTVVTLTSHPLAPA